METYMYMHVLLAEALQLQLQSSFNIEDGGQNSGSLAMSYAQLDNYVPR